MADQKPAEKQKVKTVKVVAVYPPFVDLIKNVEIGETPVEIELHPWLQAQIDAGKIVLA
jgi:hypothetical protein